MTALLQVVERAGSNLLLVEEYLARTNLGDAQEAAPSPPAAGGEL
jgi:hypothetical protein